MTERRVWCPFHDRLTGPMHVCWRIYELSPAANASRSLPNPNHKDQS